MGIRRMILNPSRITTFLDCPYKWALRYRLKRRPPRRERRVSQTRELGTLYHAATEGWDWGLIKLSGGTPEDRHNTCQRSALHHLERKAHELKAEFRVQDRATIDALADEVETILLPQYADAPHHEHYEPVRLEYVPAPVWVGVHEGFEDVKVGAVGIVRECTKVTAKLDRIVRCKTGKLYPWERKVTARDDSSWERSWVVKLQTTIHALLLGVSTVFVEQVVVTRRKAKNPPDTGQPLSKAQHYPVRSVYKSDAVREGALSTIRKVARNMQAPVGDMYQNWEACFKGFSVCEYFDHCRGLLDIEDMEPVEPDYIDQLEAADV